MISIQSRASVLLIKNPPEMSNVSRPKSCDLLYLARVSSSDTSSSYALYASQIRQNYVASMALLTTVVVLWYESQRAAADMSAIPL